MNIQMQFTGAYIHKLADRYNKPQLYAFWVKHDSGHSCEIAYVAKKLNINLNEFRKIVMDNDLLLRHGQSDIIASEDLLKLETFTEPYIVLMKMVGE